MVLYFTDKENRVIRLTNERIRHIGPHMHLSDKIHRVEETLKAPDIYISDDEQEGIYYSQKYIKQENMFFIVVIKAFNGDGFIVTIFERKRPKGI